MTYTQNDLDNRWLHKYNISFSFSQNKSVKIQLASFLNLNLREITKRRKRQNIRAILWDK